MYVQNVAIGSRRLGCFTKQGELQNSRGACVVKNFPQKCVFDGQCPFSPVHESATGQQKRVD